jgi:hypothetical protein
MSLTGTLAVYSLSSLASMLAILSASATIRIGIGETSELVVRVEVKRDKCDLDTRRLVCLMPIIMPRYLRCSKVYSSVYLGGAGLMVGLNWVARNSGDAARCAR